MLKMTKSELVTDLRNIIGPGIEVDNAGLTTWINDAYMYMVDAIAQENPDYFTKSATADLVSAQQEYDLPDDFDRFLMGNMQIDGVWKRLTPLPNINYIPVIENTDSSQGYTNANPHCYIVGSNIGIMPIPGESVDEGLKLWYVYTPEELSADSDEPAIPAKFHHIIKYGAYANYLDQDDEHVAAENMRRRFEKRVEAMVESLNSRQVDVPKSVEITRGQDLYYSDDNWI